MKAEVKREREAKEGCVRWNIVPVIDEEEKEVK